MAREGIPFDINQLKPENLEELIEHLSDFTSTSTAKTPRSGCISDDEV
jgi:hypothetical protein